MTDAAVVHAYDFDPACDCKQCVTAQRDLLRDFARAVMQAWHVLEREAKARKAADKAATAQATKRQEPLI